MMTETAKKPKHESSEDIEMTAEATSSGEAVEAAPETETEYKVLDPEEIAETKSFNIHDEEKSYQAEFPGHEALREKIPQAFKVADAVVDEWKKDGDFNGIPVGHPLAQVAVGAGLRQAKKIEKKLEEKGVFAMAKMGLDYAKAKAEQSNNPIVNKILEKIK